MSNEQADLQSVSAISLLPTVTWSSYAWRFHRQKYDALDLAGSLRAPGRFHRGRSALYLALGPHTALGERLRHIDPNDPAQLAALNEFRLTKIHVRCSIAADAVAHADPAP